VYLANQKEGYAVAKGRKRKAENGIFINNAFSLKSRDETSQTLHYKKMIELKTE